MRCNVWVILKEDDVEEWIKKGTLTDNLLVEAIKNVMKERIQKENNLLPTTSDSTAVKHVYRVENE